MDPRSRNLNLVFVNYAKILPLAFIDNRWEQVCQCVLWPALGIKMVFQVQNLVKIKTKIAKSRKSNLVPAYCTGKYLQYITLPKDYANWHASFLFGLFWRVC